ncbi:MAG: 5-oxoprolinase subunit PxpB [Marinoscillum sp.]|uniref:5-oxoprolinase subunit PxpB n=1 Tax=Marinoscillum sp. TaxID=2024838 RepID=UPI0032FA9254
MNPKIVFRTLGPETLLMEWPEVISSETLGSVTAHFRAISNELAEQIITCYPAYCSIAILFDTNQISAAALQENILELDIKEEQKSKRLCWELPVCYDDPYGVDLLRMAEAKKTTPEKIVLLHTQNSYPVYFFGFLPGFMYLGGLPTALHYPRKQTPVRKIPQGSVAIGGNQTGIYPASSPGGWHVIGNCPVSMFDPSQNPPCFIQTGDAVKFTAVEADEYLQIKELVAQGQYRPQTSTIDG